MIFYFNYVCSIFDRLCHDFKSCLELRIHSFYLKNQIEQDQDLLILITIEEHKKLPIDSSYFQTYFV